MLFQQFKQIKKQSFFVFVGAFKKLNFAQIKAFQFLQHSLDTNISLSFLLRRFNVSFMSFIQKILLSKYPLLSDFIHNQILFYFVNYWMFSEMSKIKLFSVKLINFISPISFSDITSKIFCKVLIIWANDFTF